MGYKRENGKAGVRNQVLVIPTVSCALRTAQIIKEELPEVLVVDNQYGCAQIEVDNEQTMVTLAGLGKNPNIAKVLVVSLGCETLSASELVRKIAKSKKETELLVIQEDGGSLKTAAKGIEICRDFLSETKKMKREGVSLSELVLATECGGSDAFSGISANPALGISSDMLVKKGGTVIIAETTEFIGAEHLLRKRAVDEKTGDRIIEIVSRTEKMTLDLGINIRNSNPGPGNIRGGLTTLEEKSLGCINKAGSSNIIEVLEYGYSPTKNGLVIMDTPGQDVQSVTGMTAGGAQVVAFTTGRGTPLGSLVSPVIKISSNSRIFEKMKDNIDINAGTIVDGKESLDAVGERIFRKIINVANGERTAAERLNHREFGITRIGPTF
ncbi:UxaA family hydrolase [candidate division KSB1 bacterium]